MSGATQPPNPRRPPDRLAALARGSTANLAGAGVSSLATLVLTLVVTRGASQQVAGVFFAVTSVFMLTAAVSQLGTNVGLVYFLSRARSLGTLGVIKPLYRMTTRVVLPTSVLLAALMFVFAPAISSLVNPELAQESTFYLRTMAPFLPLIVFTLLTLSATRGMGTMRPNVMTEQVGRPLFQVAFVALCAATLGESALGLAWASAWAPGAVLAMLYWRRVVASVPDGPGGPGAQDGEQGNRAFWRFVAPRAIAGVAQMATQRFDIILVAALAGAAPAAIYTAATRFLVLGQATQRAVSLAAQPRLAEAMAVHDVTRARELYRVATGWLMLVTWPIYLLFLFFGEQLLAIFGKDYSAGASVLAILSLTMLVATACGMVSMVLVMAGRSSWSLYNVLLALGVQVGLDLLLIPDYGIIGAAIGWAAAIAASNLVPLVQVALVMKLHPFGRSTIVALGVTVACFGVVPALATAVLGNGWTGLLVSVAVGGLGYVLLLWRARHVLQLVALAQIGRRKRGV